MFIHVRSRSGCRYNEVVLDGDKWAARLPHIIEAFFVPVNGVVNVWEGVWPPTPDARLETARRFHAAFLERYALSGLQVPLLAYDQRAAESGSREPFFALNSV